MRIVNITNHKVLSAIKMNVTLLLQINVDRGRCSMRHWFLWARLLIAYFRPKGAWNLHLSLFCWIISIKLCLKIRKRRKTEGTSYQIKEVNYHRWKLERKKFIVLNKFISRKQCKILRDQHQSWKKCYVLDQWIHIILYYKMNPW